MSDPIHCPIHPCHHAPIEESFDRKPAFVRSTGARSSLGGRRVGIWLEYWYEGDGRSPNADAAFSVLQRCPRRLGVSPEGRAPVDHAHHARHARHARMDGWTDGRMDEGRGFRRSERLLTARSTDDWALPSLFRLPRAHRRQCNFRLELGVGAGTSSII